MNKIFCGNALDILKTLPSESVNMCVTSPPYYGLRDYGVEAQIGNEQTPYEYIQNLLLVFEEVKRVLKPDGTLWVNIADSYAGSGRGAWNNPPKDWKAKNLNPVNSKSLFAMPKLWHGIKQKDMIGVPWLLAFSLRENGWYLRSDIIWHKKNCMPESVKDRPSKCYEHIFLLSKSSKYYYDYDAVKEPAAQSSILRYSRGVSDKTKYKDRKQGIFMPRDKTDFPDMRNKRDVWSVAINASHIPGHFAVYPEKLIEPCIMAGSAVGDVVLDPFFGSGTTGVVAVKNNRKFIGIDINPEYCKTAQMRINEISNETEVINFGNTNQ